MNFPEFLDDLLPIEFIDTFGLPDQIIKNRRNEELVRNHEKHPPPYYPRLLQAYIAEGHLPPGRYYVYGTGQLTRDALPALEAGPFEILGFLDRNAPAISERFGRPVILPEEVAGRSFDHVLTLHLLDEAAMKARLLEAGVAETRIVGIQSDSRYRAFVADQLYTELRRRHPGRTPFLIVSSLAAQWSIVPNKALARIFPPEQTVHLFMGSLGQIDTFAGDVYEAFSCVQSTRMLLRCITELQPRVVYLKTSPHAFTEFLFILIKNCFPDVKIINEINDWASLFSDIFMKYSLLYNDEEMAIARYSNIDALKRADLVVCKSGGPLWERLAANFEVPCRTYFSHLESADQPPPLAPARTAGAPVRVLFAGTIGIDETPEDGSRSQGSNFLRYLRVLGGAPGVSLDIFNSGHMSERNDHVYAPVVAYLTDPAHTQGRVAYHRLRPFAELMKTAWQWDFGLAASHYPEDRVENVTRVGIGNKLMGYVAAGIPAIIDNRYGFASALIERFEAGIVIAPERLGELPALLEAADRDRLRAGMHRLRAHLIENNAAVLEAIAAAARIPTP